MAEFWDIYDENRNKTGKLAERDGYEFKDGEYHIVVTGITSLFTVVSESSPILTLPPIKA